MDIRNQEGPPTQNAYNKLKPYGKSSKKLFTNRNITLKIRMLIWNATVRSVRTYVLQTKKYSKQQYGKLGKFTFACHRKIIEPDWIRKIEQKEYTSRQHINKQAHQPIIQSWMQKLRLSHYAKQTSQNWTIRTRSTTNTRNRGKMATTMANNQKPNQTIKRTKWTTRNNKKDYPHTSPPTKTHPGKQ